LTSIRSEAPVPGQAHPTRLALIRGVHTAAWLTIESCVGHLLWTGATGRTARTRLRERGRNLP
jgi:hypothetical protein